MRYLFASNYIKGVVLDAGCGVGYGTNYLGMKAESVVGVDVSRKAIKYSKNYKTKNVTFMLGDVTNLPFKDNCFDIVISFEVIEHLKNYEKFLQEVRRVLKSDGLFICSTPNIKYTRHPPFHLHEFYPEEFFEILEKYFSIVERYGQYISYYQRLKDVIQPLLMKVRKILTNLLSRLLYSQPLQLRCKEVLKSFLRRKRGETKNKNLMFKTFKISKEMKVRFSKNDVVQIGSKLGILRIMVAICKK